jgi:hypothetical protein
MSDALLFEWDEAKSSRNRAERGFDFDSACRIFAGPSSKKKTGGSTIASAESSPQGKVGTETFVVVYTWRGKRRRIISARPAKRRERDAYRQTFS